MRILLDENLDWRLERFLPGHIVKSVPRIGWAGLKNGKLLARANLEFDVLLTMDGSMASEQNLTGLTLAVVALRSATNRLPDTSPLMPLVLARLSQLKPGTVTTLGTRR